MLGDSPPFSSRVRAYVWLSVLILVQRVCYQASPWSSSSSSSSLCYLIITIIIIVWHCFFSSLFWSNHCGNMNFILYLVVTLCSGVVIWTKESGGDLSPRWSSRSSPIHRSVSLATTIMCSPRKHTNALVPAHVHTNKHTHVQHPHIFISLLLLFSILLFNDLFSCYLFNITAK